MNKKIANEQDVYSRKMVDVVRISGITVPFIIIVYGMLAHFGYVPHSPSFTLQAYFIISALFVVAGIWEITMSREKYAARLPVIIGVYTILAAAYAIWIGGFDSPVVFAWVILLIVCDLYYGLRGFILNSAVFVATSVIAFLLLGSDEPLSTLSRYLTVSIFVSVVGGMVSALRSVQAAEHIDLQRTKQENLVQQDQLLTLINSIGVAMLSTSSNGTIRVYNAALLSLLDTNDSLSGKSIDDAINTFTLDGEPLKLSQLTSASQRLEREDILFRYEDGEEIRLSISMSPIQGNFSQTSGAVEGFIFLIQDITKAKSLEEERDEFISVVSHELRTPITIAEGTISNAKLFLERGATPEKLVPALAEAHEQITFLASMVNDLGTLSRAERGAGDAFEEIDLTELANGLYHKYEPRASKKGLTLHLDAGVKLGSITTSRLYLEEILQNFVTNAIKYTQKGDVTITIKRSKGGVTFAVKDSGIGMSKTDLARIFEKFYRSEDYRTRETSGTGLGLYVTKKLAHKIGVKIEVTSRLNHGSTFSFVHNDAQATTKQPVKNTPDPTTKAAA